MVLQISKRVSTMLLSYSEGQDVEVLHTTLMMKVQREQAVYFITVTTAVVT